MKRSLPCNSIPIFWVIFVDLIDIIWVCSLALRVEKLQVGLVTKFMLKPSTTVAVFCIWFQAKVLETMNLASMISWKACEFYQESKFFSKEFCKDFFHKPYFFFSLPFRCPSPTPGHTNTCKCATILWAKHGIWKRVVPLYKVFLKLWLSQLFFGFTIHIFFRNYLIWWSNLRRFPLVKVYLTDKMSEKWSQKS